jgi:uncharacterized protein
MSMNPAPYSGQRVRPLDYGIADRSISRFMNNVYAWMCAGLALTAAVAWWVSTQPELMRSVFRGGAFLILIIAQLALVMVISRAINAISSGVATALFMLYSAMNGLTLSAVFIRYSLPSVGAAFVVTAGMFGAMSLIGYITKRDLTRLGSFLLMGLIGFLIASIVNIFWANSTLFWITTYAGVVIFLGLTAYDTQKLRDIARQGTGSGDMDNRIAIVGSLTLYLDFINLLLLMLRIMGDRRR